MPHYDVTAVVTTDVVITVEADSPDDARDMFDNQICMSATLIDIEEKNFTVSEDSIRECEIASVEQIEH